MSAQTQQPPVAGKQPLTGKPHSVTLVDREPSSGPNITGEGMDSGIFAARQLRYYTNRRRALLGELMDVEEILGLDPKTCKHCHKPLR